VPQVETCRGCLTEEQVGEALQLLAALGESAEVQELTAALTSNVSNSNMVQDMRTLDGHPYSNSFAFPGPQSWEQSGVMQEVMRALEQNFTVPDQVAVGNPAMVPAPIGTPAMTSESNTPAWMLDNLVAASQPRFEDSRAGTEWLDRFASWDEGAFVRAHRQFDEEEASLFPALPISPPPPRMAHLDG
jgi:hypothetical protein